MDVVFGNACLLFFWFANDSIKFFPDMSYSFLNLVPYLLNLN